MSRSITPPRHGWRPNGSPEVAVEHRHQVRDDGERELWICRAPSETHLRRWAEATGLTLVVIERP